MTHTKRKAPGHWRGRQLNALTAGLQVRYPDLKVVGAYAPPFRQLDLLEDLEIVKRIREARPRPRVMQNHNPRFEALLAWQHSAH